MGRQAGEQERVAQTVGFVLGAATAIAAVGTFQGIEPSSGARGRWWAGLIVVVAFAAIAAGLVPRIRAERYRALSFGVLPYLASAVITGALDLAPEPTRTVRAIGFLLSVALLFGLALVVSRRKREVDQLVFREASLFAFFATVVATVAYGALVRVDVVPEIPLGAAGIFGMAVWLAALFVLDRRYS